MSRLAVEPPTLRKDGTGGKRAREHLETKSDDPLAKLAFPDHWNKADVRGALYASFPRVCAYCGAMLAHNDRGDVEHFRPKGRVIEDEDHGGYWWLAYDFGNYFLSCRVCNSNKKGDRFPILGGTRVDHARRSRLDAERRALLDPEVDTVEQLLTVDFGDLLCPMTPVPDLDGDEAMRVAETIKFFDLNTNVLLIKERKTALDDVLEALEARQHAKATKCAFRSSAHSLVARAVLERHDNRLLPDVHEESSAHIDHLRGELEIAAAVIQKADADSVSTDTAQSTLEELLWALAYLKCDPAWHPRIADVLERLGAELAAEVNERVEELG